jgi:hypothetical protein
MYVVYARYCSSMQDLDLLQLNQTIDRTARRALRIPHCCRSQKGKGKFRSHRCEVRSPAVPGAGGRERDNIGECATGPQFDEACPHSTERVFRGEGGRFLWCGDRVCGLGRGAGSAHGLAITKQQKEGNDVLPPGPSLMSPHSTEMVSDVRGEGRGSMWVPG